MSESSRSTPSQGVRRSGSRQAIQQVYTANRPSDYVYFDRTTAGFSDDAVPRAKAAQLKLEHYYKVAVDAAIERNTRLVPSLK
jgi:protein-serine/threonine kinase